MPCIGEYTTTREERPGMTHRLMRPLAFALSWLVLASCSDTTTEPATPGAAGPTAPALAVASNSWITRTDMPTERWALAAAAVTNDAGESILYAIGGTTTLGGSASLSKVQAYNVATNTWTTKAPLPVPIYWSNGVGVIGGKLYISGGLASFRNYMRTLYMYDPATNAWTRKHDLPSLTFTGVTGVINGRLYVLTGCNDAEACAPSNDPVAFYRYDPPTDHWAVLPKPTRAHAEGMGGVIGGKFYVTGGDDETGGVSQLDVYDPATNRWATKAPMPRGRWLGAGTVLGGKLYVMGGDQFSLDGLTVTAIRTTIVYDPSTDTWKTKAPLPTARAGIAASRVVLNGQARIEVVGGNRPGNNLAYVP